MANQNDMTAAANTMLDTEPAKAYFGSTLNDNQKFIEFIYENTLGKTYAEDPVGVNYWVAELEMDKSKGQVVATMINAVMDPQYEGLPAQVRFINKVSVCNYTADRIATVLDVNDLSAFVGFISDVNYDPETVTEAEVAVDLYFNNSSTGGWLPTKTETDQDANGTIDQITYTSYDDSGNKIEERYDNNADGTIDYVFYYFYNESGYDSIVRQDLDADGFIDTVFYTSYDIGEHKAIVETDDDANGAIDSFRFHTYNVEGSRAKMKIYEGAGGYDGIGNLTSILYITLDANEKGIKTEEDNDLDGLIENTTETTYDTAGRPIIEKTDQYGESEMHAVNQISYDNRCNMLRVELDETVKYLGFTSTVKSISDFDYTYDGYGNIIKLKTDFFISSTMLGNTSIINSSSIVYFTNEYFAGADVVGNMCM
jgi:hypothetical protein